MHKTRIPVLRGMVKAALVAFLSTSFGQNTTDKCIDNGDCPVPKCCKEDQTCSVLDGFSVAEGGACTDRCVCKTNRCNNGICEKCTVHDDCKEKCCLDGLNYCSIKDGFSVLAGGECLDDCECVANKCCTGNWTCSIFDKASVFDGDLCFFDCECKSGLCIKGICDAIPSFSSAAPTPAPLCPPGSDICNDPHLKGLRGRRIDVAGVDGGWYCLVKDHEIDLQVNVRFTAPLPAEFPHRQLITGVALLSNGHSLVIEVKNPYDTSTKGCPDNILPCLVDGGLRIVVDGRDVDVFLHPTRDTTVFDDVTISASNLPVECRQFGDERIWARMYEEMLHGQRQLQAESFEDWVLRFDTMAAYDWCTKYITERGLDRVQSNHGLLKITTSTAVIRLNAGVNHQGDGEQDLDGRVLPNLDFWQMDVGFEGLAVDQIEITGILGETARPVLDDQGQEVMSGDSALRGTVENYRVSGPLGTNFALMQMKKHYQL